MVMVSNKEKHAQDFAILEEDLELIKSLIEPGPRQIGLVKEYNENVRKSIRVVPIVNSLASLGILKELIKIRELLEVKEEEKEDTKKLKRK